ncbi:MAG: prephenate dehydrogenase [bacterium]|nr:prephenate dehydrogenase [bacterium]
MTQKMATIVGVNGGFGQRFAAKMHNEGWLVKGTDLQKSAARMDHLAEYSTCKAGSSNEECDSWLKDSSLVLLCVPTEAVFWWMHHAAGLLPQNSLCVDILSVKTEVVREAKSAGFSSEYLSLHPMFSPRRDFSGLRLAAVPVRDGKLTAEFLELINKWEAHVSVMQAEEHDKGSAVMQAAVHAVLLALGQAAVKSGVTREVFEALGTPVSSPLFELIEVIAAGDPEVYSAIQRENPYAAEIREHLLTALKDIGPQCAKKGSGEFAEMIQNTQW